MSATYNWKRLGAKSRGESCSRFFPSLKIRSYSSGRTPTAISNFSKGRHLYIPIKSKSDWSKFNLDARFRQSVCLNSCLTESTQIGPFFMECSYCVCRYIEFTLDQGQAPRMSLPDTSACSCKLVWNVEDERLGVMQFQAGTNSWHFRELKWTSSICHYQIQVPDEFSYVRPENGPKNVCRDMWTLEF